ncbi:hypothetical protein BO83DRAFT_424061 [Aspergillus eucalypticola CBS 122712]|uniref:Uncharacterized protein n=1 Tax=Aspergillus eucalypticola (strain CBS 122712 / IBT 29274) TaxID=1448314 RepID=A0A317W884_ASPEC|nr:uncharacterized protein BO83DRAFT_424061 [Aspergillus eucalypticola CBS 122712]PWY81452.1 hypothetical protein BO83DRAFT_424061 [Aspergillus eucalypticola CBS 122712]
MNAVAASTSNPANELEVAADSDSAHVGSSACLDHASQHFIRLPDTMFSSIMAAKPSLNPHYQEVKAEADAWIGLIGIVFIFDDRGCEEITCSDIFNKFDEGRLSTDLAVAEEEIKQTMALMKDGAPLISMEDNPIQHIYQTCWYRLSKSRGLEIHNRRIFAIIDSFNHPT